MNIAIIGMSGRYPGATNIDEFESLLRQKKCQIKKVPQKRIELLKLNPDLDYQELGFLDDIECFDNLFFNISAKEAVNMSPEQRIALELAAQAIWDGGYSLKSFRGSNCGVFVASQDNDYYSMLENKNGLSWIGSMKSIIPGRIAYTFDLHGPNAVIDTGCSSVLVAADDACMRLENGKIDYALVGGVTVYLNFGTVSENGDLLGIEASNGRCKPFDASADGIGAGEGGGFLLLKREEDAVKDGDHIYGIIKSTALSGDGIRCPSMTTPSVEGQIESIVKAWKNCDLKIDEITELEAHGTGTKLGDPIEVESFDESFRLLCGKKNQKVQLGSVKGNLGHLNANAGVASIEKILLSFKENVSYPICGFENPNPLIDFESSVLEPCNKIVSFEAGQKRVAGINSFGLSGTNAHIIIENKVSEKKAQPLEKPEVLKLSAKSENSLLGYAAALSDFIQKNGVSKDLIATLNSGRDDFECRGIIEGKSKEDFINSLKNLSVVKLEKKSLGKKTETLDFKNHEMIKRLYLEGYDINWKLYSGIFQKVPAPSYVFEKNEFWGKFSALSEKNAENSVEQKSKNNAKENVVNNTAFQNSVEEELKQIWIDVLECKESEVSFDTDFFDLGGNSLLITLLVKDISEKFGVDIPVDDIYEFSTINMQAKIIKEKSKSEKIPEPSLQTENFEQPANPEQTSKFIELVPMQQLVLNSVKADPESSKWNLCISFKLEGKIDVEKLSQAFLEVAKKHQELCGFISTQNGKDVFEILPATKENLINIIPFDEEKKQKKKLDEEALTAIDVFKESLAKFYIYEVNAECVYILLKISHIIADGWTLNLIFDHLCKCYRGEKSEVKESPFSAYAAYEKEALQKAKKLSGEVRPAISLKNKKIFSAPKYSAENKLIVPEYLIIGADRFEKLNAYSKENRLSLFQTSLAVYHKTIQQLFETGQSSIAIMQANRTGKDFRNTTGFLAKTVLVQSEKNEIKELLNDVKTATSDFMKNQYVSIADFMNKDCSRFEDFVDFMLTYQNFSNSELTIDGVKFIPNMISASEAACPLVILFYNTENYLLGTVLYSPQYFSKSDIKNFINLYQNNIDKIIQKISEV